MAATTASGSVSTVSSREFLANPRAVTRRAEKTGPVVITNERGEPRISLHCPRVKQPIER